MINKVYVNILADKIINKEINPITNDVFKIEDIKKEEYKEPVIEKIEVLKQERGDINGLKP